MSVRRPDGLDSIQPRKVILFSPHCDDIAYSLTGRILAGRESAQECVVATVFTRSTFAPYSPLCSSGDVEQITCLRLGEELEFCRSLGLAHVGLGLPEAPLRGFDLVDDLFTTKRRVDDDPIQPEVERLLGELSSVCRPDRVYCPLGIAGHVDHLIVRQAIESVFVGVCPVHYYEDLPYAGELTDEEYHESLTNYAAGLRPETIVGDWLDRKLALLGGYTSQVAAKDKQSVRDHTRRVGGERGWVVP